MKILVILIALVVNTHHCRAQHQRRRPNFDCQGICGSRMMRPVCSEDNITYNNECFLDCFWKYKKCDGPCPCRQNNNNGRQRIQQNNWQQPSFRPQPQVNFNNMQQQRTNFNNMRQQQTNFNNMRLQQTNFNNMRQQQTNFNNMRQPQTNFNNMQRPPYQVQYRPQFGPQSGSGTLCICDGGYDPVCTDYGTENNDCLAACHNKRVLYDGECGGIRRP